MSEHNLENFMTLAKRRPMDEDIEYSEDGYYRDAYTRIAAGQKYTWNWCAFFFGGSWLLYRKMYVLGFTVFLFSIQYTGYISVFFEFIERRFSPNLALKLFPVFILLFLLPSFALGFIGNWLYVKKNLRKIDREYHKADIKNIDKITWRLPYFFVPLAFILAVLKYNPFNYNLTDTRTVMWYFSHSFCTMFACAIIFACINTIRDKRKVAAALTEQNNQSDVNDLNDIPKASKPRKPRKPKPTKIPD